MADMLVIQQVTMPDYCHSDYRVSTIASGLDPALREHSFYGLDGCQFITLYVSTVCPIRFQGFVGCTLDFRSRLRKQGAQLMGDLIKLFLTFIGVDVRVKNRRTFRNRRPNDVRQADKFGTVVHPAPRAVNRWYEHVIALASQR
jgi:hypothetical protein